MKSYTKYLILIVSAVFCVSLVHSFYFKIRPAVDARAYDNIAFNVISGNGYVENAFIPIEKDTSIIRVGPGYELFLAGVYKMFGHNYQAVWIFQAIFQALIALFVFLISKEILKDNWRPIIGFISAILAGFSPDLIVASSMLLSENIAIFLMTASVYFFFKHWNEGGWFNIIVFTILFSFSVLVRSQFAVLAPLFTLFFILKKQWLKLFIFSIIILLVFLPWILRNYKVYKTFIPFNAALGYNLWNGNHIGASGEMEIDYYPMINYAETHTPIETHQKGIGEFKKFLTSQPTEFLRVTLKRISIFFSFSRPTGFWPDFSGLQKMATACLSLIYSSFLFTLGASGIIIMIKKGAVKNEKKLLFLLLLTILIPFSVAFILVETRYRYPIYPFLAIFSGMAVSEFFSDKKTIKIFIGSLAVLLMNSIFDFIVNFEKFFKLLKNFL